MDKLLVVAALLMRCGCLAAGPTIQVFPAVFHLNMGMVSESDSTLYNVQMSVDTPNNMMALEIHLPDPPLGNVRVIFNFTAGEFYFLNLDKEFESCETFPLRLDSGMLYNMAQWNPWIWLYTLKLSNLRISSPEDIRAFINKTGVIETTGTALDAIPVREFNFAFRMSDVAPSYKGKDGDRLVNITSKWSDPSSPRGTWNDANNWKSFPVENEILIFDGTDPKNHSSTVANDQQSYVLLMTMSRFKIHALIIDAEPNNTRPELFIIPEHVYCRRSVAAVFPPWAATYHFEAEVAIPARGDIIISPNDHGYIFYTKEYYDTVRGLSAASYQKQSLKHSVSSATPVFAINDHNIQMTFQYDRVARSCSVRPLGWLQLVNLEDAWDLARLHLSDPISFFDFSHRYSLDGGPIIRGIATEKYVTQRRDWPSSIIAIGGINVTTVWEWFIAKNTWIADELFDQETRIPIKLDITMTIVDTANRGNDKFHGTFTYNLFNFHSDEGAVAEEFDVAACAAALGVPKQTFALLLDPQLAPAWQAAMGDPELRKRLGNAVSDAAFNAGGPESRLRIALDWLDPEVPSARLSLFAPFNYTGSGPPFGPKVVVPIGSRDVVANWTTAIATEQFGVLIPLANSRVVECLVMSVDEMGASSSTAQMSSVSSTASSSSPSGESSVSARSTTSPNIAAPVVGGYSTGSFVGFGLGMAIFGIVLGIVGLILISKFVLRNSDAESSFIPLLNMGK